MFDHARVTKEARFDAGHRIPYHDSVCRHCHGHGWTIQATFEGRVSNESGSASEGMVMDFGKIKELMQRLVVDEWDHSFLVWEGDSAMIDALKNLQEDHRTVVLPFIPTCENLAWEAFERLRDGINDTKLKDCKVLQVRLYETPNSWADATDELARY